VFRRKINGLLTEEAMCNYPWVMNKLGRFMLIRMLPYALGNLGEERRWGNTIGILESGNEYRFARKERREKG